MIHFHIYDLSCDTTNHFDGKQGIVGNLWVCFNTEPGSPADINTKAENRAISSSERCIEHKFFPNSKTELIKSSQPVTVETERKKMSMREKKESQAAETEQ